MFYNIVIKILNNIGLYNMYISTYERRDVLYFGQSFALENFVMISMAYNLI